MASWRDHLNEIDPDHVLSFLSHVKSAKSAKSPPENANTSDLTEDPPPFGAFDTFGIASLNAEGPAPDLGTSPEKRTGEEPDQLRGWRDAFSAIDRDRPPKGYQDDLWRHLHRDGIVFLDPWGANAVALGWSTLDLFGVHRIVPMANYSAMGLVPLLRGAVVVALTVDEAVTRRGAGAVLTFRRQPPHPEAVPVWDLASRRIPLTQQAFHKLT